MNRTTAANGPPSLAPSAEEPAVRPSQPRPRRGYQSEEIAELAIALAAAQAEIENPAKTHENPHFKSKYADLAEILNVCRKPLATHGLSVIQIVVGEHSEPFLRTMLLHVSGQWIAGEIPLSIWEASADGKTHLARPQTIGSLVTYMRRYTLAGIVGVAQEDDDGNATQSHAPAARPQRQPAAQARPPRPQATAPAPQPAPSAAPPAAPLNFTGKDWIQALINEYEGDWAAFCVKEGKPHTKLVENIWQAINGVVSKWVEDDPREKEFVEVKGVRKKGKVAVRVGQAFECDRHETEEDFRMYLDDKWAREATALGVNLDAEPPEETPSNA